MSHEVEFHSLLHVCATNARVQLNEPMIAFYDEALCGYGYELVCVAIKKWMRKQRVWSMPTVAALEEELNVKVTDRSQAEAIVGRIWESIGRFGFGRAKEAREHIGEAGWHVVLAFGGWYSLCVSELDQGQTRAQMREFALSMMERARKGVIDEVPQLPSSEMDQLPERMKNLVGEIGSKLQRES